MLNVLITGANGQLGSELKELVSEQYPISDIPYPHFHFTDRDTLNITDFQSLEIFCKEKNINVIINCAAYTAVDNAENDVLAADTINHLAVKYMAEISKELGIKLIHISTDYVFDGKNYKPYTETDITNPQNEYGKTKLDGENAMIAVNPPNSIIIRTSWVYSSYGTNFVKTMLVLGKEKESLNVIYDQVGTPTYARDLAETILQIVGSWGQDIGNSVESTGDRIEDIGSSVEEENAYTIPNPQSPKSNVEIYHYSNEGVASWYDFAKEIMKMAKIKCQINPIETKDYPTLAARPHYSLLNKAKIKKDFGLAIPYWKDSLQACLKRILDDEDRI